MKQLPTETEEYRLLNDAIDGFFEDSITRSARIDPSYKQLWQSLHTLIRSGGKRLRPTMTIMAYKAFGGQEVDKIIPIAAAQELLHFSLLIHDDIIDRDYVRYGVPNIAGQYKVAYSKFVTTPSDQTHYAHSAALLGGDLMLSSAYQLIASSELSHEAKAIALNYLGQSIFDVAGGELLDTELSFSPYKPGDALKVAKYKTAGYSFVSPLLTGAMIAGIDEQRKATLQSYATSLGIAFQLVDDLLGVFGDENETGKSASSDIVEGKRTYLMEQALELLSDGDKTAFMLAFGNPLATSVEVENVKQLLEKSGAREATVRKIREYTVEAQHALDNLGLDTTDHKKFASFISQVTERTS